MVSVALAATARVTHGIETRPGNSRKHDHQRHSFPAACRFDWRIRPAPRKWTGVVWSCVPRIASWTFPHGTYHITLTVSACVHEYSTHTHTHRLLLDAGSDCGPTGQAGWLQTAEDISDSGREKLLSSDNLHIDCSKLTDCMSTAFLANLAEKRYTNVVFLKLLW